MGVETVTRFDETASATLVRAFESCALDPAAFHHLDHVKLTWALLRRMPLAAAIDHLRDGLMRFVASVGKPDRYHETITVFFTTQIHERMAPDESWEAFAERNDDLLGVPKDFLGRYYRESTLKTDAARLGFVPPDLVEGTSVATNVPPGNGVN